VEYFCDFQVTAQSKQSLIGRIFAKSGHPELESLFVDFSPETGFRQIG
jgi:hypothetical protein